MVLLLTALLAAANGGNDVSKGIATLAGAGVTRYRTAVAWGALTTTVGCLFSLAVSDKLTKLFSSGIVSESPTDVFTVAVLVGTVAWVSIATATRLPVSTTQALVGALVGAGLLLGPGAVEWGALPEKIVLPTVLAIGLAYGTSFLLNLVPDRSSECICITSEPAPAPVSLPDGALAYTAVSAPKLRVTVGTVEDCRVHGSTKRTPRITIDALHWLSSGAVGFARGLNDAPKLVAIGAFTLVPGGMSSHEVLYVVAAAMAVGSLLAGRRVAQRLGDDVVQMSHVEGAKANVTTAALVGLAAGRGFPLSTTQVSTSAIAGASGTHPSRLNKRSLRDFAVGWLVTPVAAGLVAAGVLALFG
jgi:PiT family inorganic phosphate transporter